MVRAIRLILNRQLKRPRQTHKTSGFTLLELLVAMIIAALVIAPLLGFMIDILSTDRKERAKAATEQDLQSAIDYMAHDLEQAVYIYDGTGINRISAQLPPASANYGIPVLVFWKRSPVKNAIKKDNTQCDTAAAAAGDCNESFVYAIVAYYLTTVNDTNWSKTTRISRWEMKDGVRDPVNPVIYNGGTTTPKYLYSAPDPRARDLGFQLFDLNTTSGSLEDKMNNWISKISEGYPAPNVLIDYIDQSTDSVSQGTQVSCKSALGIPTTVPPRNDDKLTTTGPNSTNNTYRYTSFYACVDSTKTVAQIYIRGNALARVQNSPTYSAKSPYFPTATVKIQGRGFLYAQQ